MKVTDAAKIMGVSPQFVRIGLQTQRLPFGSAVKMSSKWTYHISEKAFQDYMKEKK